MSSDLMPDLGAESDEDVLLMSTTDGPVFIPLSVSELEGPSQVAYAHLHQLSVTIREYQEQLNNHVVWARETGVSWSAIGFALGVTPQGARQRYAKFVREAGDDGAR